MKTVDAQKDKEQTEKRKRKTTSDKPSASSLDKNWLEWTVFGISIVLVASIVCYLLYLEVKPSSKDFRYEINFEEPKLMRDRFMVALTVANKSNQSVQDLSLEIKSNGENSETADLQIDYLPRHSHREAKVFFIDKPTNLEGHIQSFNVP